MLSGLELGGAEKQAINFAKYLKHIGHSVSILGLTTPGRVNTICGLEGIECISMPIGDKVICYFFSQYNRIRTIRKKKEIWVSGESLMLKLAQYMKKKKIDVCISYCTYANTILGCAKKYYSKPVYIWYQRDAGIFDETEGYQKLAIEQMDYVLANGESGQRWIEKAYGKKAILIENGIMPEIPLKSRHEWRKKLAVNDATIVCTMVANLSSAKDHLSILKVWKALCEKKKDINMFLVFAGRFDDQYENLLQFVNENKLTEKVMFLGEVNDIAGLMTATDICMFGAKSEGSPNGIIEAGFAELPVVATDLPEIREVLAEDNYKYLFGRHEIDYAVESLLQLAENKEIRERIGLANKRKIEGKFSYEKNFKKIIALVEKASK